MLEGGYFAQERLYQRMKLPDAERNLETIMMNMQNMMKQAQKLKKDMDIAQAELAATEFTGKSSQDLVVATLTGDKKVVKIEFKPEIVDPEDLETLSDLTSQAINHAINQINEAAKQKLSAFSGGLSF